jgi:hypothetical protein
VLYFGDLTSMAAVVARVEEECGRRTTRAPDRRTTGPRHRVDHGARKLSLAEATARV